MFLVFSSIALVIFITGIILFILKYRSKKIQHDTELRHIDVQHKAELMLSELNMQQQTMAFIGKEIHDSVAQKLTLASIYSHKLEQKDDGRQIANISKLINEALLELRQLSRTLVDAKLKEETLSDLIVQEQERINLLGVCKIDFKPVVLPMLDVTVRGSVFRIIQEFVQNSLKHAGCTTILIELQVHDHELLVSLADNGRGFDVSQQKPKGIGLDNMKSRILNLDGNFRLTSDVNGTRLNISVPLKNMEEL